MINSSNLHVKLKEARLKKGYTQNEVAAKLNISRQAVSRWENGLAYPDIDNLSLLSDIYDISIDELLGKQVSNANDAPNTSFKTDSKNDFFNRECIILIFLLFFSAYNSVVGLIVSSYILIYTLSKRKFYKFLIFLSVIFIIYNLYNVFVIVTLYLPDFSSVTIEKID